MKQNKSMSIVLASKYFGSGAITFLLLMAGIPSVEANSNLNSSRSNIYRTATDSPTACTVHLLNGDDHSVSTSTQVSPQCYTGPFSVLVEPNDSNGDGWKETCIKVSYTVGTDTNIAVSTIYGLNEPSGWTFNAADSLTNNGYGGDAGTQSNDAEVQVLGDVLSIYANDYDNAPGSKISGAVFPSLHSTWIQYNIHDQYLGWTKGGYGGWVSGSSETPNPPQMLFALAGEPDATGPSNSDIYICANRVVDGGTPTPTRVGKGLRDLVIDVQQ